MAYCPTPEQDSILAHDWHRHARVLAGPGTGKSATLVALIDGLMTAGTKPRVRLLTFTRAATAELAKKVSGHPAAAAERPSTIHSFAISVLARNPGVGGLQAPLRLADDWEYKQVVRPTLAVRTGVSVQRLDKLVREMAANWESLQPNEDPSISLEERSRFLGARDEHRRVFGYTLLQELPYALRRALLDHPNLEGVDYDLLVVDEYQDLNACDLEVIKLVAERGCSVIGAGDDDQSIYSFRKAHPEGIRRFLRDYPGSADYQLSLAQRCGRRIIEWATHVIDGDLSRPKKPALTPAPECAAGEVALLAFASEADEAEGVAALVRSLVVSSGVPASEILVLLRGDHNGSYSRPIREALTRQSIVSNNPDRIRQLLEDPLNRRVIALHRLACHRTDSLAWATLLQLQPGVGPALLSYLYRRAVRETQTLGDALEAAYREGFSGASAGSGPRARQLVQQVLEWLDSHPVPSAASSQWGQWILMQTESELVPRPTEGFCDLLANLDETQEDDLSLQRYLAQIQPLGEDMDRAESAAVRIMTMASAKGLTVRSAIIVGVEDGVVPRPGADLGEERRLLYVAMTRAREHCFCTWARRRYGPTARAGTGVVGARRSYSHFLNAGPVGSVDGVEYLAGRGRADG